MGCPTCHRPVSSMTFETGRRWEEGEPRLPTLTLGCGDVFTGGIARTLRTALGPEGTGVNTGCR